MTENAQNSITERTLVVQYLPQLMSLVLLKTVDKESVVEIITLALLCSDKYDKLSDELKRIRDTDICSDLHSLFERLKDNTISKTSLTPIIEKGGISQTLTLPYRQQARQFYDVYAKAIKSDGLDIDVHGDIQAAIANIGGTIDVGGDLTVSFGSPAHIQQAVDEVEVWVEKIQKTNAKLLNVEKRNWYAIRITLSGVAITVGFLLVLALVIAGIVSQTEYRACFGFAPLPMTGTFKVLVADFDVVDENGNSASADTGRTINAFIASELRQIANITVRDGSSCGVEMVTGSTEDELNASADAMALEHGADVVIYGTVIDFSSSSDFQPEFRIAPSWAATQPELNESNSFGETLTLLNPPTESELLSQRIGILRAFVRGVGQFLIGQYEEAERIFLEGIEAYGQQDNEVFLIMAGNAASRRNECEIALAHYSQTLDTRPTYARGLLGRGDALFRCASKLVREHDPASGEPPTYDPTFELPEDAECQDEVALDDITPLIAMARLCIEEASDSIDVSPVVDMDVKTLFFAGTIDSWLSINTEVDAWDSVASNMEAVIKLYNDSPPERQQRLTTIAVRAHEELGRMLMQTACTDPESIQLAITHFETAHTLINEYPDREYKASRQRFENSQLAILRSDNPCG